MTSSAHWPTSGSRGGTSECPGVMTWNVPTRSCAGASKARPASDRLRWLRPASPPGSAPTASATPGARSARLSRRAVRDVPESGLFTSGRDNQGASVPTHVALLRGINVGGRNRVAMAALREVVEGLGHTGVATYIQSGNVVFTSEELAAVAAAQRQAREAGGRDEAKVVGTTLYLHTPDGYGRSELAARLARIGSGRTAATARNWATVRKLLAMCDS